MFKNILFDLDGTLTDPAEGITNAVMYALSKYNINVDKRETLYKFIGPPLIESFTKFYGFSEPQAMDAVAFYREYYVPKGIYENRLYDGIPELLKLLKEQGYKVMLATSKPEPFAIEILKYFGIFEYFDFVGGATIDERRNTKVDVLRHVIKRCNLTDLSECIMVGDREYDVLGAYNVGMSSLGVLYGYGSFHELSVAGANFYANTPMEILKVLNSQV